MTFFFPTDSLEAFPPRLYPDYRSTAKRVADQAADHHARTRSPS